MYPRVVLKERPVRVEMSWQIPEKKGRGNNLTDPIGNDLGPSCVENGMA